MCTVVQAITPLFRLKFINTKIARIQRCCEVLFFEIRPLFSLNLSRTVMFLIGHR